jgi:hypothetical protein
MGLPIPGGFSDVDVQDFTPMPSGTYGAKIVAAEWREANDDTKKAWEEENPGEEHPGYINWEFDITEPEEYNNRKAWRNTSLTPKGLPMLKELLLAVGETDEDLNNDEYVLEPSDHIGKDVRLSLGIDRKRPDQNKVKRVLPYEDNTELP